jgi:hypothetical protein
MEPWLDGGVLGAQMRAYGRLVSVVDVLMFCACALGERLWG